MEPEVELVDQEEERQEHEEQMEAVEQVGSPTTNFTPPR